MTALDVCQRLLRHFNVDPRMYQVGRTKLFFRAGVLGQLEDTWARIQRCAFKHAALAQHAGLCTIPSTGHLTL